LLLPNSAGSFADENEIAALEVFGTRPDRAARIREFNQLFSGLQSQQKTRDLAEILRAERQNPFAFQRDYKAEIARSVRENPRLQPRFYAEPYNERAAAEANARFGNGLKGGVNVFSLATGTLARKLFPNATEVQLEPGYDLGFVFEGVAGGAAAFAPGRSPGSLPNPRGLGTVEAAAAPFKPVVASERQAAERGVPAPVRPGQTGSYGELNTQRRSLGQIEPLDMDHQPSFAAQVAAREAAMGRELSKAELNQLRNSTPAVASPRRVHQTTSPTYGGRNTPAQVQADAADLSAAQARDRAAFDAAMRNR
jgi:hypothetical protein